MPIASFLRPRFSLRALLVVMTLFALALLYHLDWIRQRRELIESGEIFDVSEPSVPAPGILGLFGEEGRAVIYAGANANETEEEVERRLAALFPEAEIYVEIYCPPESFDLDGGEVLP
jgi:hypothetical protein